jgi:REP element-mobilizing transposase RayT
MVIRKRLNLSDPALFFVTTTIREWTPIFNSRETLLSMREQLGRSITYHEASLVGYVIMPSHLHLLVGLRHPDRLPLFMEQLKSLSSRLMYPLLNSDHLAKIGNRNSKSIWMPRYDELVVVSEEQFQIKLKYFHQNPVKSGLVEIAEAWEYSSAGDWLFDRAGALPIDKEYTWLLRS